MIKVATRLSPAAAWLGGAFFALGAALAPASAQAACSQVPAPAVSVQVVDPGPRVSSTKSLDQINAMAGSHGLTRQGSRVLGLTEIDLDSAVNVRFKGERAGAGMCVSVSRVEVKFGLKKHYVHVPREYPRGTCQFNVVMRHEMAHVDVNRRTVRKYAQVLKNEVRSVLRQTGAHAAHTMVAGQRSQAAVLQKVIDDVSTRFRAELEKLHAQIDAPNSRYMSLNKCRSW